MFSLLQILFSLTQEYVIEKISSSRTHHVLNQVRYIKQADVPENQLEFRVSINSEKFEAELTCTEFLEQWAADEVAAENEILNGSCSECLHAKMKYCLGLKN